MSKVLTARRIVLTLTGLSFLAIAVGSLIAPVKMAEPLGYRLDSINALNEFRAIYVGLWLVHAGLCFWASRRIRERVLGDIAGLLVAGQVVGRLISIAIDGLPEGAMVGTAAAELAAVVLIFVFRPAGDPRS